MRPITFVLACALAAIMSNAPRALEKTDGGGDVTPLTLLSAHVSLEGTSNIHAYTASTTTVRVTEAEIGGVIEAEIGVPPAVYLLTHFLRPGGLKSFAVTIPVASLTSPREGIDKNMHKALKAEEHSDIRFRLAALEAAGDDYRTTGWLTIAGVEREVTLNLKVERKGPALAVTGTTDLLMTDFGITPPKAMLGMLRTNPKVQVQIDLLLGTPLT